MKWLGTHYFSGRVAAASFLSDVTSKGPLKPSDDENDCCEQDQEHPYSPFHNDPIKLGHCEIQIRPLWVKTGQYPFSCSYSSAAYSGASSLVAIIVSRMG